MKNYTDTLYSWFPDRLGTYGMPETYALIFALLLILAQFFI